MVLASEILTDWVDVKSMVRTDTAFCSKTRRSTLMSVLGSPECILKGDTSDRAYDHSLTWMFKRNVRSVGIVAGPKCELAVYMKYVLKYGKRIHSIRFTLCNTENPTFVSLATLHCPNVTSLEYDGCSLRALIGDIISHNPKIQLQPAAAAKSVRFSTPAPINVFCHKLTTLRLVNCYKLTGLALTVLLEQCGNLTTLSLHNSAWLTDHTLIKVSHLCSKVTYLDISSCFRVSDIGLGAAILGLPDLHELNVNDCNITDSSLISIAANCVNSITALHMSYCTRITAKYVNVMARRCTRLRTLSIDLYEQSVPPVVGLDWSLLRNITTLRVTCSHLISDGLLPIAQHCSQLQHLQVCFVTTEFSQELLCVLQYCAYLRTLVIHTQYAAAVPMWRELRPDVHITHKPVNHSSH